MSILDEVVVCGKCQGVGTVRGHVCLLCGGHGAIPRDPDRKWLTDQEEDDFFQERAEMIKEGKTRIW